MTTSYIVVLITTPDLQTATKIGRMLVEERLAACANLLPPIRSIYRWEGQVQEEEEILMVVKTRADLFDDKFVPAVQAIHPYTTPEIIALPILKGSKNYLEWIGENTL